MCAIESTDGDDPGESPCAKSTYATPLWAVRLASLVYDFVVRAAFAEAAIALRLFDVSPTPYPDQEGHIPPLGVVDSEYDPSTYSLYFRVKSRKRDTLASGALVQLSALHTRSDVVCVNYSVAGRYQDNEPLHLH